MGILTGIILAAAIAGLITPQPPGLRTPAAGQPARTHPAIAELPRRAVPQPGSKPDDDGRQKPPERHPRIPVPKKEGLRPDAAVPALKTDLRALDRDSNLLVWFGHSSYLLQAEGRRVLVDPVFRAAAPFSFLNRPFKGTDIYRPGDMPDVDLLVITHDHWDHLDYRTVTELKSRIGKVVCPLGVGEHFEYWGFEPEKIIELDWHETAALGDGFAVHCLPSRHFSGRGLNPNRTLWASFLLETPARQVYMGGDGGYGKHFAQIGRQFPGIDLAILENRQYNEAWKYIHTMPDQLSLAAKELGAKQIITVHHSKFALARHRWDEPLATEAALAADTALHVLRPEIGEVVPLRNAPAAVPVP